MTGGSLATGTTADVVEDCVMGGVARAALGRSVRPDNPTAAAAATNEIAVTDQKEAGPISRRTGKAAGFAIPEPLLAADRPGMSRSGSTGVIVDSINSAVLDGGSGSAVEESSVRSRPGWWVG